MTNQQKPKRAVQPVHDEPSAAVIRRAHERLDELAADAARVGLWGTISVQVVFEAGQARAVVHRRDGREKL